MDIREELNLSKMSSGVKGRRGRDSPKKGRVPMSERFLNPTPITQYNPVTNEVVKESGKEKPDVVVVNEKLDVVNENPDVVKGKAGFCEGKFGKCEGKAGCYEGGFKEIQNRHVIGQYESHEIPEKSHEIQYESLEIPHESFEIPEKYESQYESLEIP
ncbi:hypothetical protein Tco_0003407 [Tanacetum coccineum]